jgi:alpha-N-arabinofuranosidase
MEHAAAERAKVLQSAIRVRTLDSGDAPAIVNNYDWTNVLMRECVGRMWGLSYHYYCGSGKQSRSVTQFDESDWFHQLRSALRIDEYIARHATVMDRYDPEKRVALVVDEWGAWHEVEPSTNPGFLYQQNTLRDALVAGLTLNILNAHSDRVRMANLAQAVNGLPPIL